MPPEYKDSSSDSNLHISIGTEEDREGGDKQTVSKLKFPSSQIQDVVVKNESPQQSPMPNGKQGTLLSPRLERLLIENLQAMERNLGSVSAKTESKNNDSRESADNEGPKAVRMFQDDDDIDVHPYSKKVTNTIKEMSCES